MSTMPQPTSNTTHSDVVVDNTRRDLLVFRDAPPIPDHPEAFTAWYNGTPGGASDEIGYIYNKSLSGIGAAGGSIEFRFQGTQVAVFGTLLPIHPDYPAPVTLYSINGNSTSKYTAPNVTNITNGVNFYTSPELPLGEHVLTINVTTAAALASFNLDWIEYNATTRSVAHSRRAGGPTTSLPITAAGDDGTHAPTSLPSTHASGEHPTSSASSSPFTFGDDKSSTTSLPVTFAGDDGSSAPGSPPPTVTSVPSASPPSRPPPVGAIVGGVIGGLALILATILTLFFWGRRRRMAYQTPQDYDYGPRGHPDVLPSAMSYSTISQVPPPSLSGTALPSGPSGMSEQQPMLLRVASPPGTPAPESLITSENGTVTLYPPSSSQGGDSKRALRRLAFGEQSDLPSHPGASGTTGLSHHQPVGHHADGENPAVDSPPAYIP
ncbi:hypothetical protein C8Q78DRAFT_375050 [Trametes maxima]|nr:hypothetical protein C8Q78DRAFT_375050 [Trametes maxima]